MTDDDAKPMFCGTCKKPLDYQLDEEGFRYLHPASVTDGHEIVPVTLEQVGVPVVQCDFCTAPGTWTFPCKTFESAFGTTSVGHWCACQTCHDLIVAGRYDELTDRAWTAIQERHGKQPSAGKLLMAVTHRQFRDNRIGDPVPGYERGLQP